MESFTKVTVATVGLEIMNHPPYSPDFVPNDFHLVGPVKVNLGGQKFQTADELKCSDLDWIHSQIFFL
jgi:hypothetical protein